jgi:hypothetical protein
MFELFRFFRTQRKVNAVLEFPNVFITYLLSKLLIEVIEKLKEMVETGSCTLILDTKEISDGKHSSEMEKLPDKIPKSERQENWRKYIAEFGLEEYLDRLFEQVGRTRYARKCFLKQRYEFAIFRTMDGVSF